MSIINSQPLIGASGQGGGYNLTKSLRFRSSASAYLNRTPSTNGSGTTFTWSGWVKRGILTGTNHQVLFSAGTGDAALTTLIFDYQTNQINFLSYNGTTNWQLITSQVFRDPSAWYHIVAAVDTTQATSSDRIKLYVNGIQITSFSTSLAPTVYPSQNYASPFVSQSGVSQFIGRWGTWNGSHIYDGYMTEINFIDGQALTPSSFGQTSSTTGVWIPKKYTGTYGTNGFYLPFTDVATTSGSNAGLGKDFSGNGNYWTTNNISVTSGSTYDSMKDVPTLTDTDTANYCVLNPLVTPATTTIINGNLGLSGYTAFSSATGTIGVSSGKWYFEFIAQANAMSGITGTPNGSNYPGQAANSYAWDSANTTKYNNNSGASYGSATSAGDIVGVAFDLDSGSITFYKNNVSQGTAYTFTPSGAYFPVVRNGNATNTSVNFGQRPFTYTPPTGFVALNTFNLPTPTIGATASSQASSYFNVVSYSGNSPSSQTIAVGFQPDFVWQKSRGQAYNHTLYDAVRGATKELYSNTTGAETTDSNGLTAFTSNGFTVGSDGELNDPTAAHVAWTWKANGSGSTNTAGSITSTVSANTTAGFSIVTYTGTGTTATIGHGLGVAPSMIITKNRTTGGTEWIIYHASLGATRGLYFNTSAAATTVGFWNNTAPTSSVFTVYGGNDSNTNGNATVAYCFAQIAGYSAFGSYTGNGSSDGTFVYTGFRPRYIMIKPTNVSGEYWQIIDTSRNPYNADPANMLSANLSAAESGISSQTTDILSNGFKLRGSGGGTNGSGTNYIYMAFAESPFKFSNAR